MQKQYKARQEVGRFHSGNIVSGINDSQIQDLLQRGVIEIVEETAKTKPVVTAKTEKEVKADVQ